MVSIVSSIWLRQENICGIVDLRGLVQSSISLLNGPYTAYRLVLSGPFGCCSCLLPARAKNCRGQVTLLVHWTAIQRRSYVRTDVRVSSWAEGGTKYREEKECSIPQKIGRKLRLEHGPHSRHACTSISPARGDSISNASTRSSPTHSPLAIAIPHTTEMASSMDLQRLYAAPTPQLHPKRETPG